MREADSIINHIVKNTMVEAAGLTEMFLGQKFFSSLGTGADG